MAVYLISFALSVLLIAYAEKRRLRVFLLVSAVALLIPCLVAGLRAQNIGTDVMVYVKPLTNAALSARNFAEYQDGYWFAQWRNLYVQDYEIGFSALVYVVAKLTHSLGAVLFMIEALMVVPVYVALARDRKNIPVWLGMLVFYLMFYNTTLNMMRQWIAMAFLLLAFRMLLEKKWWLMGLFCVVGTLFHNTAVLAVPVFGLFWVLWLCRKSRFVHNNLRLRSSSMVNGILFVVAVLAVLNLPVVLKVLSMVGLGQYSNYLQGEEIRLMLSQIVLRIPFVILILCSWRQFCSKDIAAPFYMAMLLLDIVISQLVSVDTNALRIGSYFSLYTIVWLPAVYRVTTPGVKRTTATVFAIGYMMVYWYYTYVIQLRNETYPYAVTPFFN